MPRTVQPLTVVPEGHEWLVVRDGLPLWSGTTESSACEHAERLARHRQHTTVVAALAALGDSGFRWQTIAEYQKPRTRAAKA